jgi:Zn ribbon nucleic-acid-binding protein
MSDDETFAATRPTSQQIRFSPTPALMGGVSAYCPDCPIDYTTTMLVTAISPDEPVPHLECMKCGSEFSMPMIELTRRDAIDGG